MEVLQNVESATGIKVSQWQSRQIVPAASGLRDQHGLPDLSWLLKDYSVPTVVEKMSAVLNDGEVPLGERCRRAQIFWDELIRRSKQKGER